jgi:hypothetical protein
VDVGSFGADLLDRLVGGAAGPVERQALGDHDVRARPAEVLGKLLACGDVADDVHVRLAVDDRPEPGDQHRELEHGEQDPEPAAGSSARPVRLHPDPR